MPNGSFHAVHQFHSSTRQHSHKKTPMSYAYATRAPGAVLQDINKCVKVALL